MQHEDTREGQLLTSQELMGYLGDLLTQVREVQGDIVECGVGKGYSLSILSRLAQQEDKSRLVYGYDSFKGLPSLGSEDEATRAVVRNRGSFAAPISEVLHMLASVLEGCQWNVVLIPGWLHTLTTDRLPDKIALLHLDLDLYRSYKIALHLFWPKVVIGGIVAFDEYQDASWPGCAKSVDEFLVELPEDSYEPCYNQQVNRYYIRRRK